MERSNTTAPYVSALRFRWLTRLFDKVLAATLKERAFKQALVEQARLEPSHRILDVGAGTGTLALLMKASRPETQVVALDGDPEILEIARQKSAAAGVDIEFREGMSFALPFADGSFDRVVSSLVFHHLSRDAKRRTLAEIRRVLTPGGEFLLLDWGKAQDPLMRLAFVPVQLLDGIANTADNVRGDLLPLMREAGLLGVSETLRARTLFGTLSLYRAVTPVRGAA